jgi:hypothetical protein
MPFIILSLYVIKHIISRKTCLVTSSYTSISNSPAGEPVVNGSAKCGFSATEVWEFGRKKCGFSAGHVRDFGIGSADSYGMLS